MQTKKSVALLFAVGFLALMGQVAFADTIQVTYTTTGIFAGTGTSVLANDYGTVTYNVGGGISSPSPDPTIGVVTSAIFGSFTTSVADFQSTEHAPFVLTLTQTAPPYNGTGIETFNAQFSGKVGWSGGNAPIVTFSSPLSQTISGPSYNVTYTLPSTVALNTDGGTTNVVGTILVTDPPPPAVPEPASLFLLGTGLGALGLAALRRKNRGH